MVATTNDTDWQTVLSRVVTPDGYIRWSQFNDPKSAARPALERYLALLAIISPDNRPDLYEVASDRTAYWINAYNAACIYGVLLRNQADPVPALYEQDRFLFGGRSLTLNEIENARLSAQTDPRILFALNRCTRSSPPLRAEPYQPNKVNFALWDQAGRCLTDPRFVVISHRVASLNQKLILDHRQEFVDAYQKRVGSDGTLLQALQLILGQRATLKADGWNALPYDGSLNTPRAKTPRPSTAAIATRR
jgi:hypothetical protein